jgi:hypothetical protein
VEKDRFLQSVRRSKDQLLPSGQAEPWGRAPPDLNINIMMLETTFSDSAQFIETERVNAEWAVNHTFQEERGFRRSRTLH